MTEPGHAGLAELYATEAPGLRRLAYLLTGSVGAADDVVQDAFAAVSGRLGAIDNPAAYLRTVVVNGTRRWHGRLSSEQRWVDREGSFSAAGHVTSSLADRVAVRAALGELSETQREAVVLRFFADLTYEQIGDHMACPTQTAATHVRRGLARLRTVLEDTDA